MDVKQLLFVVLVVGGVVFTGWAEQLPAPIQSQFDEWVDPLLGADSPEFATFQRFSTAIVRGDMRTVATLITDEDLQEQASNAHLAMKRRVRDVQQVAFRVDREQRSADGKSATLEVSQGLTLDPVGVTSAFGILKCEGRYEVTMTESDGAWKVTSLTIKPPLSDPPEVKMLIAAGKDVAWPCADSAWTEFATAWKSTMLQ